MYQQWRRTWQVHLDLENYKIYELRNRCYEYGEAVASTQLEVAVVSTQLDVAADNLNNAATESRIRIWIRNGNWGYRFDTEST